VRLANFIVNALEEGGKRLPFLVSLQASLVFKEGRSIGVYQKEEMATVFGIKGEGKKTPQ